MRRVIATLIGLLAGAGLLVLSQTSASATSFTVSPWAYACSSTSFGNPAAKVGTCVDREPTPTAAAAYANGALVLSKNARTNEDLAAGATIGGLVSVFAISFDVDGYCGAGSPRLNITTADGKTHFFGCAANNSGGHVTINLTAAGDGSGNGGVGPDDTVTAINFVQDEEGSSTLTNLSFTGGVAPTPTPSATATPTPTASATAAPQPATLPQTGGGAQTDYWPIALAIGGMLLLGLGVLTFYRRRS